MRKKRLALNTISGLMNQVITIICGLILPRFYIKTFGSEVNGLVSSITQFLSFISFLQLGIGAVAQAAWYKPLAEEDTNLVSQIYVSAQRFFRRIAYIFIGYIVTLCVFYPILVSSEFDSIYQITLILAISISLFLQYYFGITNQLLLTSDQRGYYYLFIHAGLTILNTIACVGLMKYGASIQLVRLGSSLVYAINPLVLSLLVRKLYIIDRHVVITEEPIKQKWNGFVQHIASVIMDNTDVAVLTFFSTLSNVSIYYVYHLIVFGIRQIITSLSSGIQALFGNMLAVDDTSKIYKTYNEIEVTFHYLITLLYSCVLVLACPFVSVYTKGVTDANYNVPVFAFFITLAFASYCYRLPYYSMIKAAGHFKQTQNGAIIEVLINLTISIATVIKFGLVGVAIGTLVANLYRTAYCVVYLKKNILHRSIAYYLKYSCCDIICFGVALLLIEFIPWNGENYIDLIIMVIKVFSICFVSCTLVFGLINYKTFKSLIINRFKITR